MTGLPKSALRVQIAAQSLGLDTDIVELPDTTRTAEDAAQACDCCASQIVKSLIFQGKHSGRPYLFLVSGANRVNEKAVAVILGEPLVRPDADFVRKQSGYAIGGIPPFGHDKNITAFMDQDILQFETVWAAAGTPRCVMKLDPSDLVAATQSEVIIVI